MTFIKGKKRLKLMGRKVGMTQFFDTTGELVPCTVIAIEPNVVIKKDEIDQRHFIQLGAIKLSSSKRKNLSKPLAGHYESVKQEPRKALSTSQVEEGNLYEIGQEISVDLFEGDTFVDVMGVSKGKGFQGAMKRYNFAGGPASHGSGFHRAMGSTGMRSTPGRGLPGKKMPGHMGSERVTVEGLKIVKLDKERNLLLVKGAIPGANDGLVYVRKSVKRN